MSYKSIKVLACICERCDHKWNTRSPGVPVICPSCKTPYWNKPKIEK